LGLGVCGKHQLLPRHKHQQARPQRLGTRWQLLPQMGAHAHKHQPAQQHRPRHQHGQVQHELQHNEQQPQQQRRHDQVWHGWAPLHGNTGRVPGVDMGLAGGGMKSSGLVWEPSWSGKMRQK
jgi:hypothetical protein